MALAARHGLGHAEAVDLLLYDSEREEYLRFLAPEREQ
jgi:hypothetical protein